MKKNFNLACLATIVAAAFAFTACSTEEPVSNPKPQEERTISFTSTVNNNVNTRATSNLQNNAIANGVGIGIYGTVSGGGNLANATDAQYTSDGSGGLNLVTGTTAMSCTEITDESSISFNAYAPTGGTWNEGKTQFTIQPNQTSDENYLKSDLLKGTGSLAGAAIVDNAQAALSFQHQLSQIKIVLQNAEGVSNDFADATVTIKNTLPSISYTASTGTLGDATGTATDLVAGTGATNYAVIVPQTIAANTPFVEVCLGDHTLTATIGSNNFTFVGRQSYVMTITVGDLGTVSATRNVALGNPTISLGEWQTPDNTNLGSISVLPRIDGVLGTMVNGANNAKWETDTYSWWNSTSNLMTLFTFSNGELANYKHFHIKVTLGDNIANSNHVRLNFLFSDGTNVDNEFYSYGEKNLDMTAMNSNDANKNDFIKSTKSLAEVVAIRFGGKTAPTTTNEDNAFNVKVEDVYITRE